MKKETLLKNKIFQWFLNSFPDMVEKMRQTNHAYSLTKPSPHHLEGDVWTHTCLAYNSIDVIDLERFTHSEQEIILLSVILHDVGKPCAWKINHERERVNFYGHEKLSTLLAYELLMDYQFESIDNSTENRAIIISKILLLIQSHSLYWQLKKPEYVFGYLNYDFDLLELYHTITGADYNGQIKDLLYFEDQKDLEWGACIKRFEPPALDRNIYLMVGPPASGKDTYISTNAPDAAVIGYDEIRWMLFEELLGEEVPRNSDNYTRMWEYFKLAKINLDNILRDQLKENFNNGVKDIYISNTSMSRKSRRKFFHLARQNNADIHAILTYTSFGEMIKRDSERGNKDKSVGAFVIRQMCNNLDIPVLGEGFKTVTYSI